MSQFEIILPRRFVATTFFGVVILAFAVGRLCRLYLLDKQALPTKTLVRSEMLPVPVLPRCKKLPNFTYVSRYFGTGASSSSDNLLVRHLQSLDNEDKVEQATLEMDGSISWSSSRGRFSAICDEDEDDEDIVYHPAGQHLMVDIKNVDGMFLNSEFRLAMAMVNLIQISGLTLLSYHCHQLPPVGVSCVGVLLESHVSFHTWPVEGVITFDIFTCGDTSLMPLLPFVERLFGVQRRPAVTGGKVEKPHVQWSYKNRGFRYDDTGSNPSESSDLNQFVLGWFEYDMKKLVVSKETDFQRVEIYEVIKPNHLRELQNYKNSIAKNDSYESKHPELFRPDRVIYLDGIMQSRLYGEAAYHEALVHPTMFAHPNPRRVAIIGGGEGATLREILKHKTVEKVTMIEIDEEMVSISREYIPEWSDCSNLRGSAHSCFDDPRTEAFFSDAIGWFIDRFGDGRGKDEDKYDVIIMDALDPSDAVKFSDVLYDNAQFAGALSHALRDDGVMICQVGEEQHIIDASAEYSLKIYEHKLMTHLRNNGFEVAKDYTEAHGGFLGIWRFLVLFKDREALVNWYADQATVDLKIARRAMETKDGSSPFRYFDGSTMMTYQFASRPSQEVFCRKSSEKEFCAIGHGLDPEIENAKTASMEVRQSTIPGAGRGLFARDPISNGTYISGETSVHAIVIPPLTTALIRTLLKNTDNRFFSLLNVYMFGYGFAHDFYGDTGYSVESSPMIFTNHGCHGTYNIGMKLPVTEMNADPKEMPVELMNNPAETAFYNPFFDRNHLMNMHSYVFALRDIQAGEEILDNYLSYLSEDNWETGLADYRAQCAGEGVGAINRYEDAPKETK